MHTFFVALGLRYPLVQAPMAGVQDARLAIAASRAGALGSLPCAMLDAKELQQQVQALRTALGPTGVFNLNFFCHRPQPMTAPQAAAWREVLSPLYAGYGLGELPAQLPAHLAAALRQPFTQDIAKAIAPFRPPVLSFHFGLPEPALLEYARSWGARIIASATTVQEALWLQAHGADAIIAQGLEAGGHRGHFLDTDTTRQMGLFALLPQVVDAVRLPVIAAGGIAGPREVRAAFALGASAVQAGTAYLLADESLTSALHRQALTSAAAQHTALTRAFTGGAARGIVNTAVRTLAAREASIPPFPLAAAGMAALRNAAEKHARADFSPLWSGQNNARLPTGPAASITHALGRAALQAARAASAWGISPLP